MIQFLEKNSLSNIIIGIEKGFEFSYDYLFIVGHQIKKLRQFNGIAKYPKTNESEINWILVIVVHQFLELWE